MEGSANHSFHFICQILGVKVKITVLKVILYLLKLMKSRNKDC